MANPASLLLRGGNSRTRTYDFIRVKDALYQLSYAPMARWANEWTKLVSPLVSFGSSDPICSSAKLTGSDLTQKLTATCVQYLRKKEFVAERLEPNRPDRTINGGEP